MTNPFTVAAYGVYISRFIRYSRASICYSDIVKHHWSLSKKSMSQGFVLVAEYLYLICCRVFYSIYITFHVTKYPCIPLIMILTLVQTGLGFRRKSLSCVVFCSILFTFMDILLFVFVLYSESVNYDLYQAFSIGVVPNKCCVFF